MSTALGAVLGGVVTTVVLTVSAFIIGSVLGVLLTWGRSSRLAVIRGAIRCYVDLVRAVPPLVWLFLAYFGLPDIGLRLSPETAAVMTLGLVAAAYISEIYRSGLSGLHRGQWEASAALNLGGLDTVRHIVVPQVLRMITPTLATYAIGLLKDSALASTIGVLEVTYQAGVETQRTGDGLLLFGVAGVVYLLLSLPLAVASRRVDKRMRARFAVA
jgi:polar amino acid transport system permease protein